MNIDKEELKIVYYDAGPPLDRQIFSVPRLSQMNPPTPTNGLSVRQSTGEGHPSGEHLHVFQTSPQPCSESAILPTMYSTFRILNYIHEAPNSNAYMPPPIQAFGQMGEWRPYLPEFNESQLDPALRSPMTHIIRVSHPSQLSSKAPPVSSPFVYPGVIMKENARPPAE